MPKLKHWVGRKKTLTIGKQTYRGEVVRGFFQSDCARATSFYSLRAYENGYAFRTEEGELIRIFMSRYPRVVARGGGLVVIEKPGQSY